MRLLLMTSMTLIWAVTTTCAQAQYQDAWHLPQCSQQVGDHPLISIERGQEKSNIKAPTWGIRQNFRGDFLVDYNPLRSNQNNETQSFQSLEAMKGYIQSALLAIVNQDGEQGPDNSFFLHQYDPVTHSCAPVLNALIDAIETTRNELARREAGLTETQILNAYHATENASMKLTYRRILNEIDTKMPAWKWLDQEPPPALPSPPIEINAEEEKLEAEEPGFMIVETMPALGHCKELTGAERDQCTQLEIIKFTSSNTKYPPIAKDAGIQGTVFVYFLVGKDGKVKDARVLRSVDPRLDAEALRVIKSLPDFSPGTQQGEPVDVQYTAPVKFIIR